MKESKTPDTGRKPGARRGTFAKYRGIGTPGIGPGRKGIAQRLRKLRGLQAANAVV